MQEIRTGSFVARRWAPPTPRSLRVVDWNIDRGGHLDAVIGFLQNFGADIVLLQEVDFNARRTRHQNIAEEIARKLRMNYVFGQEFEELTQGTRESPAYHGQTTLSRWQLLNPRIIHFRRQSNFWRPRWFLPNAVPFQERLGGRIALVADVDVAGVKLATYNLHLESRGGHGLRLAQMEEVLKDASKYPPRTPVIVAGDFNIDCSLPAPAALMHSAGFREAVEIRTRTTIAFGFLFRGKAIDWAYVRGPVQASEGEQHNSVPGSDHYPISFRLTLP
jgi:endonuclease/exonuclease/phosphatase family metal-dependent hydrolase